MLGPVRQSDIFTFWDVEFWMLTWIHFRVLLLIRALLLNPEPLMKWVYTDWRFSIQGPVLEDLVRLTRWTKFSDNQIGVPRSTFKSRPLMYTLCHFDMIKMIVQCCIWFNKTSDLGNDLSSISLYVWCTNHMRVLNCVLLAEGQSNVDSASITWYSNLHQFEYAYDHWSGSTTLSWVKHWLAMHSHEWKACQAYPCADLCGPVVKHNAGQGHLHNALCVVH